MESNHKGNVAILEVTKSLQEKGYRTFSEDFSQSSKIDIIAEKDGKLLRIQTKYITPRKGIVLLNLKVKNRYTYGEKDIDYFAVFVPDSRKILWIHISVVAGKNKFYIRMRNSKTNNFKKINNWRNYKDLKFA